MSSNERRVIDCYISTSILCHIYFAIAPRFDK
jgi:hypothetical protein